MALVDLDPDQLLSTTRAADEAKRAVLGETYTKGTDFKAAAGEPVETVRHIDTW